KSDLMMRYVTRFLMISGAETSIQRRGFPVAVACARDRVELIGQTFLFGYHAGLSLDDTKLASRLEDVQREYRGFAYEGAGMALALLDSLTPWRRRRRFEHFAAGAGADHIYMLHVGAGWAFARLGWPLRLIGRRFDPLLRWLVIDGYGFHQGFFRWRRYL